MPERESSPFQYPGLSRTIPAVRRSAPPRRHAAAPHRRRTAQPPHRRTAAPPHRYAAARASAPLRRTACRYPEIGTASDLAKPGGFRRAYVIANDLGSDGTDDAAPGAASATRAAGAAGAAGAADAASAASAAGTVGAAGAAGATRQTSEDEATRRRRAYAARPLTEHLQVGGWHQAFVTDVVQRLPDGTRLRHESRRYRLGVAPQIISLPDGELPPPRPPLRLCGWRPFALPYWVAWSFLLGSLNFIIGSFCWMLPSVGDAEHGAPAWEVLYSVTYPYLLGSVFFTIGCYLAWVEVLNANLQLAVEQGQISPRGSVHRQETLNFPLPTSRDGGGGGGGGGKRGGGGGGGKRGGGGGGSGGGSGHDKGNGGFGQAREVRAYQVLQSRVAELLRPAPRPTSFSECVRGLRWFGYQPRSLLYIGATAQLLGAFSFNVACVYGLPRMVHTHLQEELLVYLTCVLGSLGFVIASYVYVLEATHSSSLMWRSDEPPTLGYALTLLNLAGSLLFFVASACYFVQVPPYEGLKAGGEWGWEYQISEWGVRFTFGVGSVAFLLSSLLSFPELLSD